MVAVITNCFILNEHCQGTRLLSQQAGLSQAAGPRTGHRTVGWPLGVLWALRNRYVSLVQSDVQTENGEEEAIKNEVGRGYGRAK